MEFTIRSNPKVLTWEYKVVAATVSIAVLIVLAFLFKILVIDDDYSHLSQTIKIAFGLSVMIGFLYRDLIGTTAAVYSEAQLLEFSSQVFTLAAPVKFSDLRGVVRRSPSCVVLLADSETAPIKVRSQHFAEVSELTVRGHSDDIDQLCKTLALAGKTAYDDGIGDDPPRQFSAIIILSAIAFGVAAWAFYSLVAAYQPHP